MFYFRRGKRWTIVPTVRLGHIKLRLLRLSPCTVVPSLALRCSLPFLAGTPRNAPNKKNKFCPKTIAFLSQELLY